uniref:Uncharacterized protein n=1 Tax=Anguilla anguilla TaxID=7936 RepID=A0A0E9WLR3_ANGAN
MNMFTIVCVQQTSVTHALTLFFHLFPPYRLFISVVISFPHFFSIKWRSSECSNIYSVVKENKGFGISG